MGTFIDSEPNIRSRLAERTNQFGIRNQKISASSIRSTQDSLISTNPPFSNYRAGPLKWGGSRCSA